MPKLHYYASMAAFPLKAKLITHILNEMENSAPEFVGSVRKFYHDRGFITPAQLLAVLDCEKNGLIKDEIEIMSVLLQRVSVLEALAGPDALADVAETMKGPK
jgi:hypothetical protein